MPDDEEVPDATPPADDDNARIQPILVEDEMSNSFLDYSMSVIISRALPDARDGLKPSQRRILLAMNDLGLAPGKNYRKCAKICGDTSGNYHPHGEATIYPTLVNMAQPWTMREILIQGQGNFGSVEGDPPAAMRYTEARLTHLGHSLMVDMEKDTVDFQTNYDETREEPKVFPAAFPNLLVNGGTGIAVGMATNIPPHNLGEVVDGVCATIDNPEITTRELLTYIKGPDFPTGCTILGQKGIQDYATTGRGSIKVRGRAEIVENKGREQIVITEIPYMVNRARLVERIAELAHEKIIPEISAVRDESTEVSRVVVDLKREARSQVVLNNLYKHTALASSYSANMLAIDHRRPRLLSLKDALVCFIEHRREVVIRRTRYLLRKANEQAERLEAYLLALGNLDDFIKMIRDSSNREEAREKIKLYDFDIAAAEALGIFMRGQDSLEINPGRYTLTDRQVEHILELRLYQLVGLEREKIKANYDAILDEIKDYMDILAREERVLAIIKEELLEVKDKWATPRLTDFGDDTGEIANVELIANESNVITISHFGYIKRTLSSEYRTQARGGKGLKGMETRETDDEEADDFVEHLFAATAHDYLMFFTNTGRVYIERVYQIPEMSRTSKGRSIKNLLSLNPAVEADPEKGIAAIPAEKIAAVLRIEAVGAEDKDATFVDDQYVFFATKSGKVKKTALSGFRNFRKDGIIAIKIEEGNELIDVKLTSGDDDICLVTSNGYSVRCHESTIRSMGRPSSGVRGVNLREGDRLVALAIADDEAQLLVVSQKGLGKRTPFSEYPTKGRGGKGIITMKVTEKTGNVVKCLRVSDEDEVMLMTDAGQSVRLRCNNISVIGRNTQGVKLMNLKETESIQDVARVVTDDSEVEKEEEEEAENNNAAEESTPDGEATES
ncbi:MAG: DNA gyrase subunit A [Verrucomicrobiales bacterium]|nr:DNA gyrase subunit A [Verrucomicrobiales bacterium]